MNFYTESNYNGELWLRDTNDNVVPANQLLKFIYLKYKDKNNDFYNDLTSNFIKKFDVFYDSFYIETENGYIFEKYKMQDSLIYPFTQINNHNISILNIDYWFDEIDKKVYFINVRKPQDILTPVQNTALIQYSFTFNVFDIKTGIIKKLLDENLAFDLLNPENLTNLNDIKEDPKLTYNPDTNNFNVSFIIRNQIKKLGLISIILNKFEIKKINTFIPFGTLSIHKEVPLPPFTSQTPTPTPSPAAASQTPTPTPTPTFLTPTPTPTQLPVVPVGFYEYVNTSWFN